MKCLQVVNSLIVPEIGQMEHKQYEKYLIWLVISCIDFFFPPHRDTVSDKKTALHKST